MLIAPKRKRNCLWSDFFPKNCFPIKAAWLAPKPGRKAVNGDAITVANEALAIDFLEILIFVNLVVLWGGIFVFCLILIKRLEAPKSPVNKGRRGSLIFILSDAIPRKPASKKIKKAQRILFFCFSVEIK